MPFGGLNTFIVSFLKTESGLAERDIMLLVSTSFIGGLSSLWLIGSRLDRLGSKPLLNFSMLAWICILTGWVLISGKIFEPMIGLILTLQFFMGLGSSLVNMSMTRLLMAVAPPMGRNHFFALYSVTGNVTLGLAPIFWGVFIDALRPVHLQWQGMEWNRFSIFFLAAGLIFALTLFLCRRLHEPQAASMEELFKDILQQSPLGFLFRIRPRS